MNQVSITSEKKMTVQQRKELMPYEVVADGEVIAVVRKENTEFQTGKTQCPNCKFVYDLKPKDETPSFFSVQHG